jgi:23S rRNA (guanosine2251-2'-O)-methyltransferase
MVAATLAEMDRKPVPFVPLERRYPCASAEALDLLRRMLSFTDATRITLEEALDGQPTVLVLGSEGDGIRRLVAEHCDVLAKIPMPGGFESLNVSNAAAIALYEVARAQSRAS